MGNDERHFLLFFSEINGYSFIPLLFLCGCIGRRRCLGKISILAVS